MEMVVNGCWNAVSHPQSYEIFVGNLSNEMLKLPPIKVNGPFNLLLLCVAQSSCCITSPESNLISFSSCFFKQE